MELSRQRFFLDVLNEINNLYSELLPLNEAKVRSHHVRRNFDAQKKRVRANMMSNAEVEQLINFSNLDGLSVEKLHCQIGEHAAVKRVHYCYALELLFIYAMKISAHYSFEYWIELARYVTTY